MNANTKTNKKIDARTKIENRLNRRQTLAARFAQAVDEWGITNRRMKIRYQY